MNIPKKIKIGTRKYDIIKHKEPFSSYDDDDKKDCVGTIDYYRREINLSINKDLIKDIKLTLSHEVIHGVLHEISQHELGKDEILVDSLSNIFYRVVRDNPNLIKYLQEKDE